MLCSTFNSLVIYDVSTQAYLPTSKSVFTTEKTLWKRIQKATVSTKNIATKFWGNIYLKNNLFQIQQN